MIKVPIARAAKKYKGINERIVVDLLQSWPMFRVKKGRHAVVQPIEPGSRTPSHIEIGSSEDPR